MKRLLLIAALVLAFFAFLPFPGRAAGPRLPQSALTGRPLPQNMLAAPKGDAGCSAACTCGCNEGAPCRCGVSAPVPIIRQPLPAPAYYYRPPAFRGGARRGGC